MYTEQERIRMERKGYVFNELGEVIQSPEFSGFATEKSQEIKEEKFEVEEKFIEVKESIGDGANDAIEKALKKEKPNKRKGRGRPKKRG